MYKFLFFILTIVIQAQQTCKLEFSNSSLSKEGDIIFSIKNNDNKKIKVPYELNDYSTVPQSIQVFNDLTRSYENYGYAFDEAQCVSMKECYGKMILLNKNETKSYKISIISGRISKI